MSRAFIVIGTSDTHKRDLFQAREALRRQLRAGFRFVDPERASDLSELLGWHARMSGIVEQLSGAMQEPTREKIRKLIRRSTTEKEANALLILRLNIAGVSHRELGCKVGLSGPSVFSIERGAPCNVSSARAIADHFALTITELFDATISRRGLVARTVGELEAQMAGSEPEGERRPQHDPAGLDALRAG